MKHFSKIVLLALGFSLVAVVFFSLHSRAASPQASVTTASTNTLIALSCTHFKKVSNYLQCDGLYQWDNNGGLTAYTPTAGTALVITDMECGGVTPRDVSPDQVSCDLGLPLVIFQAQGIVPKSSEGFFQLSMHLTSGITFTGFPGISLSNVLNVGNIYVYLQGYLIQTPS